MAHTMSLAEVAGGAELCTPDGSVVLPGLKREDGLPCWGAKESRKSA